MTTTLTGFVPDLRAALRGEVDDSDRRRAEYSTDASNYRVVPQVVAYPWDAADVAACLEVARQHGVPLTSRGAGTSVAGNAVGTGLVLDFSRHMNRIHALDPEARTAVDQLFAYVDQTERDHAVLVAAVKAGRLPYEPGV